MLARLGCPAILRCFRVIKKRGLRLRYSLIDALSIRLVTEGKAGERAGSSLCGIRAHYGLQGLGRVNSYCSAPVDVWFTEGPLNCPALLQ